MKKLLFIATILCLTLEGYGQAENTTPVAFPGAEGHGRFTTGGRGGQVIHVTNLNDAGTGSLRAAVSATGARIIVFDVSGIIELNSTLSINNGDITIAGQTAPGDGICLKNYSLYFNANNVIVRYIRSRMGDDKAYEGDAMWGRNNKDIIIDHCTLSWSTDETGSFYDNENYTMQWCILAESLRESVHDKGTHGYGGIWGGRKASFHHNMLIHHDSRNPRLNGSRYSGLFNEELVDLRNNVIYNWGGNSGYAGEGGSANFVNNYYKFGPATGSSVRDRIFAPNADGNGSEQPVGTHAYIYADGNYVYGYSNVTEDNWLGIDPQDGLTDAKVRVDIEFNKGQITTHDAEAAFARVLDYSGASLSRDLHDIRYAEEARTGTTTYQGNAKPGLIDTPSDVDGWPAYNSTANPTDTDLDGMPDDWEDANGLNKNDASDNKNMDLSLFYTNVEVYINSLVEDITGAQLAGGESNYVDKAFNATATLTAEGSSSLDFEIPINEAITDVVYNFSDAASAVASGLPEGLEATVSQSSITISGTPTEYGDFVVGISTTGNSIAATASGVITVLPPAASISVDGEDNSSQTVIIGERIENIIVTWLYADDAAVEGLPEGILTSFSATEEKLTIYGTPTEVGVFEYTVSTVGNASPASLSGTIEVTTPLNAQVASAFKIYPNPIENGLLSIEVGKSNSIHSVRIINMSGQMVFDKSYDRVKALSLDLQLSTGLYHILMNTTSGTIKEKLIVK